MTGPLTPKGGPPALPGRQQKFDVYGGRPPEKLATASQQAHGGEFLDGRTKKFKLLKSNPNHPLDFQDHSLKTPVLNNQGWPIKYPPGDARAKPVRDAIEKKFKNASKLVVLIGDDTHKSKWVEWEVNKFIEMKKEQSGEKTWKRIRGMTLKGSENARIPDCLMNGQSTQWLAWDPDALDKWLDQDPDK